MNKQLQQADWTRRLTLASMLLAVHILLNISRIVISQTFEINFDYLALLVAGGLLGPGYAVLIGGVGDFLGYLLHPSGAFFPGFTLNAMIQGFLFGLILYRKSWTWQRVFGASILSTLLLSLVLTPFWLNMMYGTKWIVIPRLIRTAILLPLHGAISVSLMHWLAKVPWVRNYRERRM